MMTTAWDWQWTFQRMVISLTFDLCSLMIGVAWGPHDIVIHVGIATVIIERWEAAE